MQVQPSLFDAGEPGPPSVPRPTRHQLDPDTWVDIHERWLTGTATVFDDLVANVAWVQGTRILFDKEVLEPRLSGVLSHPSEHPWTADVAAALTETYQRTFDSVFLNYYRNGDDAVAWHRDRIHRRQRRPLVAIVTLGTGRPFLLRPRGGGPSVRFRPLPGDLLVMGGRSQHDWEHSVPRSRRVVSPRISVTFRPSLDG